MDWPCAVVSCILSHMLPLVLEKTACVGMNEYAHLEPLHSSHSKRRTADNLDIFEFKASCLEGLHECG